MGTEELPAIDASFSVSSQNAKMAFVCTMMAFSKVVPRIHLPTQ